MNFQSRVCCLPAVRQHIASCAICRDVALCGILNVYPSLEEGGGWNGRGYLSMAARGKPAGGRFCKLAGRRWCFRRDDSVKTPLVGAPQRAVSPTLVWFADEIRPCVACFVAVVHIICVELLIVIGTCGVVTGQRVGGCGWARRAYVCRCGCYSVSCRGHYREDAGADNGSTSQATSNSQNMETEVPEDTRVCVWRRSDWRLLFHKCQFASSSGRVYDTTAVTPRVLFSVSRHRE